MNQENKKKSDMLIHFTRPPNNAGLGYCLLFKHFRDGLFHSKFLSLLLDPFHTLCIFLLLKRGRDYPLPLPFPSVVGLTEAAGDQFVAFACPDTPAHIRIAIKTGLLIAGSTCLGRASKDRVLGISGQHEDSLFLTADTFTEADWVCS